jgi:phosphoribosylformylglycinamidine (FGAM) synthase PurS component
MCERLLANTVIESYTWDITNESIDGAREES